MLGRKGRESPPTQSEVLAWSSLFRCSGTFFNYFGHLRLACVILNVSTAAFDNAPIVKRAKISIDKRRQFVPRKRLWIQREVVGRMHLAISAGFESSTVVMLFLASYVFLLRLPSDALPMVRGGDGLSEHGQQSVVSLIDGKLVLKLARRKNLPHGSVLTRSCWCSSCKLTCPVHVLGKYLMEFCPGSAPFAGISSGAALSLLRNLLEWLAIPEANVYRTDD